MRNFILLSVILPGILLLAIWLFVQFYEAPKISGPFPFIEKDFSFQGAAGTQIQASRIYLSSTSKKLPPLIIFIADLNLDRNWDAPHASFQSGGFLAEALASFGIESIRYDHRGTGKSPSIEKERHNFDLKAEDLHSLYTYVRKQASQRLFFLAHGNRACSLLLYSLEKWKSIDHEGLFLLSCGGEGNLLDIWARKVFFNMQRKGVPSTAITEAKKEWNIWEKSFTTRLEGKSLRTFSERLKRQRGKSGELPGFWAALSFFSSDEMESFRRRAKGIHFYSLLERQLVRGRDVVHIKCRYDEESPPEDQRAAFSFAKRMESKGNSDSYRFLDMEGCNHFLKEASRISYGFVLSLERANPLTSLLPQVPEEIKAHILRKRDG